MLSLSLTDGFQEIQAVEHERVGQYLKNILFNHDFEQQNILKICDI